MDVALVENRYDPKTASPVHSLPADSIAFTKTCLTNAKLARTTALGHDDEFLFSDA
jgi:hypothetical protein